MEKIESSESPQFRYLSQTPSSRENNLPRSLVPTYFARPTNPNGNAILIFSDVFGPVYQNVQLMADHFAAKGYLTVVPDLFHGDSLNPDNFFGGKVDLPEWLTRHDTATVDPVVDIVIDHLKNSLKVKKLAGVGYCIGGKVSA